MRIDLRRSPLAQGRIRVPMYVEKWSDHYTDAAAQLISAAYHGHVDSRINDQYRSAAGARRFLYNIVQYPGCGSFYRPASYAAFEAATGRLCGVSLASLVAEECGHITQICVSPTVRGTGVGHELLRQSLTTLRDMGCRSASLTVTSSNDDAVSLYERVGFRTVRRFSAYVWEGF
jgi:ribosomal protein S18 acetylase RimI-like enzyme